MKFKDFELRNDNHFVAMQYYGLILNRTFLVLLTKDLIIGIKANGLISVEAEGNALAAELLKNMVVSGNLENPYSYIRPQYIEKVKDCDLFDKSILKQNKANFILPRTEVKNAYYDARKKWGMGYYPHDGKVYLETMDGKKREFIILGNQSGQKIANMILTR